VIAETRKEFGVLDEKTYLDYLDLGTREMFKARDEEIQRLDEMQKDFFRNMIQFTKEQQAKQEEFSRRLESEYAARATKLEDQHQERIAELDKREAELKRRLAEIDERDNRQARRDLYKELKQKLAQRNKEFELTEGTKGRREVITAATLWFLGALGVGFAYCFYRNVIDPGDGINWIAVGSQIGFAAAAIATITFYIRWNNQWFQKHADEEFKLKRLDLDIDRANWLVELSMEWKKLNNSEIPPDLVEKLARSLFMIDDGSKPFDVPPVETLLSGLAGTDGRIQVTKQGVSIQRRQSTEEGGTK
jgi:hypothetical protein